MFAQGESVVYACPRRSVFLTASKLLHSQGKTSDFRRDTRSRGPQITIQHPVGGIKDDRENTTWCSGHVKDCYLGVPVQSIARLHEINKVGRCLDRVP